MTPEDNLIYLAGFFDGEGSIGIDRGCLMVRVTNCFRPTLDQFRDRFGGSVYVQTHGDEKHRLQWVWRVNGRVAEAALREMLPHLREKASQAACALAYREIPKGHVRDGLLSSLSLLKRTTHHRV